MIHSGSTRQPGVVRPGREVGQDVPGACRGRASEWLGHLLPCCWQCPRAPLPPPTPSPCRPGIPPGRRLQSKRPPSEATRQAPRSRCSRLPPVSVSSMDHRQLPCAGDQEPRLLPCTSFHFSGLCRTGRVPEATALPVPARLHRGFTACLRGGPEVCPHWGHNLYLVILVGGHRDEGSLWEHMGAEGRVFGAKSIVLVGLHDVQPRLVLVHGVEDDLEEKGLLSAPGAHPCLRPCPAGPGLAFLLLNGQGSRV